VTRGIGEWRIAMGRLLRVLAIVVALVVFAIGALVVGARFSDGPMAILAGGPFESGQRFDEPIRDWRFVHDVQEVQFQLLDPPRSRTTWIIEHDGRAFIPSGYMTTWWGRLWKQWPREAERDGRILLRIDGRIHPERLVRILEDPALPALVAELGRKYLGDENAMSVDAVTSGQLWLFEIVPRS
jgi:hypothetical protein